MKNRETNLTHRMVNRLTPPRVCVFSSAHLASNDKMEFCLFVIRLTEWLSEVLILVYHSLTRSFDSFAFSANVFFLVRLCSVGKFYHSEKATIVNADGSTFWTDIYLWNVSEEKSFCGMETSATDWIWNGKNAARIQWKKLFWKCHRSNRIG